MIHNENNLITCSRQPDNSVDLTVTSPPYDDIKEELSLEHTKYGIGIVKTYKIVSALRDYDGYEWDIQALAKELFRITKDGGVVVWIMNDPTIDGSESLASSYTRIIFREAGFRIHDTMIWDKKCFSMPSHNRCHQVFEYMFVFLKGTLKTFNKISDRENIYGGKTSLSNTRRMRQKDGSQKHVEQVSINKFGSRYNIWSINTSAQENPCSPISHPATFSLQLAKDHIYTWSNEGDLVYDPFIGSGTTGRAAHELNRKWFGSEISKKYTDEANRDLSHVISQPLMF